MLTQPTSPDEDGASRGGASLVVEAKAVVAKEAAKGLEGATGLISHLLRRGRPREFAYAIAFEGSVTNRIAVIIKVKLRCILPHVKAMVSCLLSVRSGPRARANRRVHTVSDVSGNMGITCVKTRKSDCAESPG